MSESDKNQSSDHVADIPTLHRALVDELKAKANIHDRSVEAAFRHIPRHLFLPEVALERVYSDEAIVTKIQDGQGISSSSQPSMMAIMLEQLNLQPGHHVLEIGAGTGYNAALIAHIVGEKGHVTTIELDEDTAASARQHLRAAGLDHVDVICGDGIYGYPGKAPYDRIILTVGAWDIPPAWLEQLKPDGRLVLPLSLNGPQLSVAFDHVHEVAGENGSYLSSVSIHGCGFMRLRGEQIEPGTALQLGPDPGLLLSHRQRTDSDNFPDAQIIFGWLTGPSKDRATWVEITPRQAWNSLNLWLALREPQSCVLGASGAVAGKNYVPTLFSLNNDKIVLTYGLLQESGLGLLMRSSEESPHVTVDDPQEPFGLLVRSFGPDETAARHLINHVQAWDNAGRPGIEGLRIRAYPIKAHYTPLAGEQIITTPWRQFVLDWSKA